MFLKSRPAPLDTINTMAHISMLRGNTYARVPVIDSTLGVYLAYQALWYDWLIKRMFDITDLMIDNQALQITDQELDEFITIEIQTTTFVGDIQNESSTNVSEFSIADLNQGNVFYQHSGFPSTLDSVLVTAKDYRNDITAPFKICFKISPNNEPSLINQGPFKISSNDTLLLDTTTLWGTDVETEDSLLIFRADSVTNYGRFEFTTTPGVAISEFTQTQLSKEEVIYINTSNTSVINTIYFDLYDGFVKKSDFFTIIIQELTKLSSGQVHSQNIFNIS